MKSSANDFYDKSSLLFQYHKIEPKNSDLGTVFQTLMHFANLLIGVSLVPLIKLVINNLRMD
jgi:hypothetical protein